MEKDSQNDLRPARQPRTSAVYMGVVAWQIDKFFCQILAQPARGVVVLPMVFGPELPPGPERES